MYKKGKKLDSKGIILACVGIIIVCIAINVAFALFPPTGRTDDNSAVESSAASDGAVDGSRWLRYPLLDHQSLFPQRDGDPRDS